ncbi:MAG: hypothetical protein ABIR53_07605 [Paraperlucidibaca sp.]
MTLLLALVALAAYFSLPEEWRLRLSSPLPRWLSWSYGLSLSDGLRLAIATIVPMLVLAVAIQLLQELASLFVFLLCVIVVIAIFGDSQAQRMAHRHQAEWEGSEWPSDDELLANALSLARQHQLRSQLNELFAPLFWLLLATPIAALGYYILRHIALNEQPQEQMKASQQMAWMNTKNEMTSATKAGLSAQEESLALACLRLADWIPSRFLALSFALAGNFTATWAVIRERLLRAETVPYELIDAAAEAAEPISIDPSLTPAVGLATAMHQLDSLLQRALVVWMVFLAVKTLWPGM